jgi:hypothetical protein
VPITEARALVQEFTQKPHTGIPDKAKIAVEYVVSGKLAESGTYALTMATVDTLKGLGYCHYLCCAYS